MLDFVIIGGAQAGLSMAYHLTQQKKSFLVLDGENEIGASWLNRWDSLRLFTPTQLIVVHLLQIPSATIEVKQNSKHLLISIECLDLVNRQQKSQQKFYLTIYFSQQIDMTFQMWAE